MDRINSVKLGLNNDMEVVVTADIQMKSGVDTDDVYFVMFNVLDDPLRFVVATASNFEEFLLKKGVPSATLSNWLAENPELFMGEIVKHQMEVMGNAVERVKVSLDQQSNADVARTVILSLNVSNYHIPGQTEPIQRTQKVETAALLPDFQMMLDVVKNWEGFDFSEYLRSKGVSEEDIKQMVGA